MAYNIYAFQDEVFIIVHGNFTISELQTILGLAIEKNSIRLADHIMAKEKEKYEQES